MTYVGIIKSQSIEKYLTIRIFIIGAINYSMQLADIIFLLENKWMKNVSIQWMADNGFQKKKKLTNIFNGARDVTLNYFLTV